MLDVPTELILFVSGLLAARRREIGTRKGTAGWAVTGRLPRSTARTRNLKRSQRCLIER
jgi:hypothetical protein